MSEGGRQGGVRPPLLLAPPPDFQTLRHACVDIRATAPECKIEFMRASLYLELYTSGAYVSGEHSPSPTPL